MPKRVSADGEERNLAIRLDGGIALDVEASSAKPGHEECCKLVEVAGEQMHLVLTQQLLYPLNRVLMGFSVTLGLLGRHVVEMQVADP